MKNKKHIFIISSILLLIFSGHKKEEGMFPLSHLNRIDFNKAGFRISQADIYNPDGTSLTDALVRVGGCSGSFISEEGLIITNHHCVYGSVASVSTKEKDYLENGFVAKSNKEEIKTSITCRITLSYEDVSEKVLAGTDGNSSPEQKKNVIGKNISKIIEDEKRTNPSLTYEVSEMFTGSSYTLFRYMTLKDVRLVCVPPEDIGNYGKETDNWEWPRHTGDFSIVRAYVGPDGMPAEYNEKNIPYKPKNTLKINPKGTNENDLVFILGYPGKTYRNESAYYIQYQQDYILPFISEWYEWRIQAITELGKNDRDRFLKLAGYMKSLANVQKNFEGKLQGLRRTGLVNYKKEEEKTIQTNLCKSGKNIDCGVYKELDSLYARKFRTAMRDLILTRLSNDLGSFYVARQIIDYTTIAGKKDKDYFTTNMKDYKADILKSLKGSYKVLDKELEKASLLKLLEMASSLPENQRIEPIYNIKDKKKWVENWYKKTKLLEPDALIQLWQDEEMKVFSIKDPLLDLVLQLQPLYSELSKRNKHEEAQLSKLMPMYQKLKQQHLDKLFLPDANATLRLTYGYVRGFSPSDGIYNYPYTTLPGVFEKNQTGNEDYLIPESVLKALAVNQIPEILKDPKSNEVVVAFLYNMDTTGGNSGSPIMDADGKLVGVNFDRAYTATINDYAWNEKYSRSIGVDIRYVLYVMQNVCRAEHLFKEMNVKL